MSTPQQGVVAAGHPLTADAGAKALRAGGNAVDAAIAAMLTSFVAEPLLTGLGAGGYMLIAGAGREPVLLDFFVQAPRRNREHPAELIAIDVSFGDAEQVFYVGSASCGVYGMPAGVCTASERWGTMALSDLAADAVRLAYEGITLNSGQAYVAEILADLLRLTPECAALWAPEGEILREGDVLRNPDLGAALRLLAQQGAEPFYRGEIARAVCDWVSSRGGSLTADQLEGYSAIEREPVRMAYRDRLLLTNPPPSAGGTLLAYALGLLDRGPAPPTLKDVLGAMAAAQSERTPQFVAGLAQPGFLERFLSRRLGSTTHISVLDSDGLACSVTATNGEGSGVVVPGTGMHINNIMGEEDLNPLGFHTHPAGARMPSMMAPSALLRDGEVELVLGSAGSNRIRSALLQTIVGVVDHDLGVEEAVCAPRVHFENDITYAEPGIPEDLLSGCQTAPVRFSSLNLFFGGVQAVQRRGSELTGAGDPRRGG
ncbi:MAG: gamma-glutamyltransferase family protein, partial [Solirubrobacteraceae bacterium]